MATKSGTNGGKGGKWWSSLGKWVPYIVAFLVLGTFVYFAIRMMGLTEAEEMEWARYVYVFGGIEAIAFAAAGFLFGKEVHRVQAESAEKRADDAQKQAQAADGRAANAESLATNSRVFSDAIAAKEKVNKARMVRAAGTGRAKMRAAQSPISGVDLAEEDLAELYLLAKKLFS